MAGFTYKSYNFVDKDPIIDEVRTVFNASGVNFKWIEAESGVTSQTLSKWFSGQTKKPQAATVNAVLRSLGYKLGVVPHGATVHVVPRMEQPKPRPAHKHVVQMSKYRKRK